MNEIWLLCIFTLVVLVVWALWVDVLIEQLETQRGIPGSTIAGALFMGLISWSSISTPSALPFWIAAIISLSGLAYRVIYFLRIRVDHHHYLSRHAHKN